MAKTSLRRQKVSCSGWNPVDRISGLPEPIISHILSFLPTKEAIATSILSRGWRLCWTRDTSFDFNWRVDDGYSAELIDAILSNQRGGSINEFHLKWKSPDVVFRWAGIAIARNIRVLQLFCSAPEVEFPASLYTCGTLAALTLRGPFRVDPLPNANANANANVVRLPKLTQLTLEGVRYGRDESICSLVSGCPVLEDLNIFRSACAIDNMVVCNISSPVLKHLHLIFLALGPTPERSGDMKLKIECPSLESLRVSDHLSNHISIQPQPTSLETVELHMDLFRKHSGPRIMNLFAEFMQAFCSTKLLQIYWIDLGAIERDRLPISFQRLAKLEMYTFINPLKGSSLMYFLNGCSNLEELVLHDGAWRYQEDSAPPRCLLPGIRRLRLYGFGGHQYMALLRFFLEHCSVMETVYIHSFYDDEQRLKILNQVSQLPRASPTCQICTVNGRYRMDSF